MIKNYKIQLLRGLAIIAVVLIHTCPLGAWQIYCRPFINFAVAMFIFLSGYLTKLENNNWRAFYKKRILRVLIPYIIWSILYSIARGGSIKAIVVDLITASATGHLYYVFAYIQFVLLTPFLGKLIKSKYNWLGWLIAPISIFVFRDFWLLTGNSRNKYILMLWDVSFFGWFAFYYLGLILGNNVKSIKIDIKKVSLFYVVSLFIQMGEGYGWSLLGDTNYGTQLKLSALLSSFLLLIMTYWFINNDKMKLNNFLLKQLGDYSFGIYLSHILIIKILARVPYYSKLPFVVNSILVLAISYGCVSLGKMICGEKINKWLGLQ